jgi:superfamily II DNA or RNA helicase
MQVDIYFEESPKHGGEIREHCRFESFIACVCQGVEAVAVHGDKDQSEREASIDAFKRGEKDVLVATDVASKVRH